ncbi:MAG: glycosyltransferase family 2 protein [Thiocapsa sp.]|uniref:glycosyltransferase family 2 protein n=1 Tax=Thiocapsa sp. TaxID=2024551 RepID=UPI001BCB4C33|nr:glycosyltransferase family A protein [Thiocapsa sp.]QVL50331.1 MAG: glycosyltransferase family 2 protein [Thiocapsa sp.]
MNDLVSVVIPVYNGERYIASTLRSVVEQSHENLEILVVDDGSTDGTADILKMLAQQDSRINLFNQSNKGVAAARNLGIKAAQGAFVAPLDADDIWHRERIAKQYRCLIDTPSDVGLVYSPWMNIDETGARLSPCVGRNRFEGIVFFQLVTGNFLGSASTCLIKMACLAAVGLYDEKYFQQRAQGCEDWDLYLRIARQFRFRFLPDCLTAYRQARQSMSVDVNQMMRSYDRMMSKLQGPESVVPACVFRWSRGAFLFYLGNRAIMARRPGLTVFLLFKMLSIDPVRALDPQLWRTFVRCLPANLRPVRGSKNTAPLSTSENWGDLPAVSNRPVAVSGVLWDAARRRREGVVHRLQRELEWPARLDQEPETSQGVSADSWT